MKRVNMKEFVARLRESQDAILQEWTELTLPLQRRKEYLESKRRPSETTQPDIYHIHQDLGHLLESLLFNLEESATQNTTRRPYEALMLIKIKALDHMPKGTSREDVFEAVKAAIAYPYHLWEIIQRLYPREPLPGRLKFEIEEMARAGIAGYDREQRLIAFIKKSELKSGVFGAEAPDAACSGGSCGGGSCSTQSPELTTRAPHSTFEKR